MSFIRYSPPPIKPTAKIPISDETRFDDDGNILQLFSGGAIYGYGEKGVIDFTEG